MSRITAYLPFVAFIILSYYSYHVVDRMRGRRSLIEVAEDAAGGEDGVVSTTSSLSSYAAWMGYVDPTYGLNDFAPYIVYNKMPDYRSYLWDPTVSSKDARPVLKVTYKAGAWSPNAAVQGGMLFHAFPYGKNVALATTGAAMEYSVYIPSDFQFVKGGKFPGMAGGDYNCGGGKDPTSCWSVRTMWRTNGAGEAYMYVPQDQQAADFCQNYENTRTVCNNDAGYSFRRGSFYFTPGQWHKIKITVVLNTIGKQNGVVQLEVNDQTVIYYDKVVYRTKASIQVNSLYMSSWYGGSSVSWAPTQDMHALFKDIAFYSLDSPSTALSVNAYQPGPTNATATVQSIYLPPEDDDY